MFAVALVDEGAVLLGKPEKPDHAAGAGDEGAAEVPNALNEVVAALGAAGGCPNAGAGAGAAVVLPKPMNDVEDD